MSVRLNPTALSLVYLLLATFNPSLHAQNSGSAPEIVPPEISTGVEDIRLPAEVTDLDLGGGGRYLLLHFASLKKIGVFDVNQLKIDGYIPVPSDDIQFAAGLSKLLILDPKRKQISRWDIATQNKELTKPLALDDSKELTVSALLMGSKNDEFAVCGAKNSLHSPEAYEIDIENLAARPFEFRSGNLRNAIGENARISSSGLSISTFNRDSSPSGYQVYTRNQSRWRSHYEHTSVGAIRPFADGDFFLTGLGVCTWDYRFIGTRMYRSIGNLRQPSENLIPATSGPFYLKQPSTFVGRRRPLSRENSPPKLETELFVRGYTKPLATVHGVAPFTPNRDAYGHPSRNPDQLGLAYDKRLILIPEANLVIQFTNSSVRLRCIPFDIEKAGRNSGKEYVAIVSTPPANIQAGQKFNYIVEAQSNEALRYSLESGPAEMAIDQNGRVTWQTSRESPHVCDVIIKVLSANGEQAFHNFRLHVNGVRDKPESDYKGKEISSIEIPDSFKPAKLTAKQTFEMPSHIGRIIPARSGRFLLCYLPSIHHIAVFDVSQLEVIFYIPVPGDETHFAANRDYLLVFDQTQKTISRWNLETLQREATTTSPYGERIDDVAMGCDSTRPCLVSYYDNSPNASSRVRLSLFDPSQMKRLPLTWDQKKTNADDLGPKKILAASNGEYFWVSRVGIVCIDGTIIRVLAPSNSASPAWLSADGNFYFVDGELRDFTGQRVSTSGLKHSDAITSIAGNYFLAFSRADPMHRPTEPVSHVAKLHIFGREQPIATLPGIKLNTDVKPTGERRQLISGNAFFIPNAKVVAATSRTREALHVFSPGHRERDWKSGNRLPLGHQLTKDLVETWGGF